MKVKLTKDGLHLEEYTPSIVSKAEKIINPTKEEQAKRDKELLRIAQETALKTYYEYQQRLKEAILEEKVNNIYVAERPQRKKR